MKSLNKSIKSAVILTFVFIVSFVPHILLISGRKIEGGLIMLRLQEVLMLKNVFKFYWSHMCNVEMQRNVARTAGTVIFAVKFYKICL